jgi:PIN domain nuclease of toxin-antitoxin system
MNYLLDTHTLIWSITEKKRLSPIVLHALENSSNAVYVSSVSFWEIALKFSLGKLEIQGITPDELPGLAIKTGFELISLSADESATYYKLDKTSHKDPFDRILIWQAIQRDLTLISKDERLTQYHSVGLSTLW